jgi:hypothetical protein
MGHGRGLYITIVDEHARLLFADWNPDDLLILDAAVGLRPTWAVQIDVSGRIHGAAAVHRLVALLIEQGGVAMEDYSNHPWTLPEIRSSATVDGLPFFDPHWRPRP